jgi:hypothetical protein
VIILQVYSGSRKETDVAAALDVAIGVLVRVAVGMGGRDVSAVAVSPVAPSGVGVGGIASGVLDLVVVGVQVKVNGEGEGKA